LRRIVGGRQAEGREKKSETGSQGDDTADRTYSRTMGTVHESLLLLAT
jgi:hypothetical protein